MMRPIISPRSTGSGLLARRLILVAGLLLAGPVDAFRCGNKLVSEGDHQYDVLAKCGEPDYRERRPAAILPGVGPVDVTETWYYNPGTNRLIRILRFHRGRLRTIETGGYGFDSATADRSCRPHELDTGMSKYELLARCGEPVARNSWIAHGGPRFRHRRYWHGPALVEEWTYVFGSTRLRRHVRIVNGRVADIQLGERGR